MNGLFTPATQPMAPPASMPSVPQQQQQSPPIPQEGMSSDASIQQGQKQYTGNPMLDKYIHLFLGQ